MIFLFFDNNNPSIFISIAIEPTIRDKIINIKRDINRATPFLLFKLFINFIFLYSLFKFKGLTVGDKRGLFFPSETGISIILE